MTVWQTVAQMLGVNAVVLVGFAAGALRVRSCKLQYAKLKHGASKLESLQSLPTAHSAEEVMRARGLWAGNEQALSSANALVEAYRRSSVFHVLRNSRRMETEMLAMRRQVTNCYDLAVGIHAGIAVSSDAKPKHVHVPAAGQTAAEIDVAIS